MTDTKTETQIFEESVARTAGFKPKHLKESIQRARKNDIGRFISMAYRTGVVCDAVKKYVVRGAESDILDVVVETTAVQKQIEANAARPDRFHDTHCALGIAGEAAEVIEVLMSDKVDEEALVKEIGDLWWYCTKALIRRKIPVLRVLTTNAAKLLSRYPNGFEETKHDEA